MGLRTPDEQNKFNAGVIQFLSESIERFDIEDMVVKRPVVEDPENLSHVFTKYKQGDEVTVTLKIKLRTQSE